MSASVHHGQHTARTNIQDRLLDAQELLKRKKNRMHQQKHRERRKQRLLDLENDVQTLQHTVDLLRRQAVTLRQREQSMKNQAMDVVRKLFHVFRHGFSQAESVSQEAFLRSIMHENTLTEGMNGIIEQWRVYSRFCRSCELELIGLSAPITGNFTAVDADFVMRLQFLWPNVSANEDLAEQKATEIVSVRSQATFLVERTGRISTHFTQLDLLNTLQLVLGGSFEKIPEVIEAVKLACESEPVKMYTPPSAEKPPHRLVDARLALRYVLAE